jgi:cell division protein FtsW
MTARRRTLTSPAYLLLGAVAFLVLGGLLMVYSASSVADYTQFKDSAYHLKKQLLVAIAGSVGLFVVSWWDFRGASRRSALLRPDMVAWSLWVVAFIGLVAVDVAGVGKWGATRSLALGPFFLQPSEFAKGACVLVTATLLVHWRRGALSDLQFAWRLVIAVMPIAVLVLLQPDMGTTVTILAAVFLTLLLGGVSGRLLAVSLGAGGAFAAVLVRTADYRMERVMAFLDPWKDPTGAGYQIIQSLYAFGSGGAFGVGLGLSRQKYAYLPAAHTDFIFAIIGEELGVVGALSVVLAFFIFAYAGIRIALECKDPFGRLMAGGLTAMIVTQALMNMAAVTGLMPITGIPLPFVSAGGSSLVFTLGCVGLILSVARSKTSARMRLVRPMRTRESASERASERRRDGGAHLSRAERRTTAARRRA